MLTLFLLQFVHLVCSLTTQMERPLIYWKILKLLIWDVLPTLQEQMTRVQSDARVLQPQALPH